MTNISLYSFKQFHKESIYFTDSSAYTASDPHGRKEWKQVVRRDKYEKEDGIADGKGRGKKGRDIGGNGRGAIQLAPSSTNMDRSLHASCSPDK